MQGFTCLSDSDKAEIGRWLKFTPGVSTFWIFTGTVLASPVILWLFSIIAAIGSASDRHLFDLIYNSWLRNYTKTPQLPVNPKPRRFAMFLAAAWSALTGWFFLSDIVLGGYISGLLLTGAGLLVATTHFCLGSWLYRVCERYKMKIV